MVGMGAKVLPGAVVGKNAFVDANAVVEAGTRVPDGEVCVSVCLCLGGRGGRNVPWKARSRLTRL